MADVEIKVKENGPLVVSGPITIVDVEGNEYALPQGTSYALCRCGASREQAVLRQVAPADRLRGAVPRLADGLGPPEVEVLAGRRRSVHLHSVDRAP